MRGGCATMGPDHLPPDFSYLEEGLSADGRAP
jgi:hypothetical protein